MPRQKGQVTRLKNGVWQMRVQRVVNGERKSVSKRFKTRKDAEDALTDLFEDLAKPKPKYHICKELFDAFLRIQKPHIKQQTFELYERIIKRHLRKFDELPLPELTPFVLENYFAEKKEKLSPATVVKIYRLLKTMLLKAQIWDWIIKNPLAEIRPPKIVKQSKEILTPEELNLFFAACPDEQRAQWQFAALTGCRAGEVFGAKWEYVDFEKKVFSVKEVLVRLKKEKDSLSAPWKFDEPKTESSIRKIPLSNDLIAILKRHKARQGEIRLAIGDLWQNNDLIFPTRYGKPQRISNIGEKLKRIAVKAGITKNAHPHLLRHTFITLAIDGGMDLKTVSEIVGHANVSITLNLYKQTKFENKQVVADAMSDLILGVRKMGEPEKINENPPAENVRLMEQRRSKAAETG